MTPFFFFFRFLILKSVPLIWGTACIAVQQSLSLIKHMVLSISRLVARLPQIKSLEPKSLYSYSGPLIIAPHCLSFFLVPETIIIFSYLPFLCSHKEPCFKNNYIQITLKITMSLALMPFILILTRFCFL